MTFQNHAAIDSYYAALADLRAHGLTNETQTRPAFREMLRALSVERGYRFEEEVPVGAKKNRKVDAAVQDEYSPLGYWEAKDEKDNLESEVQRKIKAGYPLSNIIFEDTRKAILWQNGRQADTFDLTKSEQLAELLARFFNHTEADREGFENAVRDFVIRIPELAGALLKKIDDESENPKFQKAFGRFFATCQTALDPKIKESAVREMLVQHLLTERLFKKVFQNDEWFSHNVIATEIENVIDALASRNWNRAGFLKSLDPFFNVIEHRARTLPDYSNKQAFLNNVYERFFQGYSTETADTMGIVYTPQEIVDWMCESVERVLADEFGSSLSTPGVKILDPCTGTGNFIVNAMNRISSVDLPQKYAEDLFANEIMLLPYYVASGNIEHEYFERMGEYAGFEGLCFADTLDLFQGAQSAMFAEENTARVEAQKAAKITVILGNPPYNVGQKNENDNNKNRAYKGLRGEKGIDDLIRESYAKASKATLQNKLYDAYVRFFKWASERLGGENGVICFVSNNSFLEQHAFDGMRKCLSDEFNHIWHLDLHGNVRKNPKLSGTTHNVFGIQVGVGITILVKNSASRERFIRYHRVPENWKKTEKLDWLAKAANLDGVQWQELKPNTKNAWITEGLEDDFETFVPLGSKEAKASFSAESKTIFKTYSLGVSTNRDEWVYDFNETTLAEEMKRFIDFFNEEAKRWKSHAGKKDNFDDFVDYDEKNIKWSSTLKAAAKSGKNVRFSKDAIRTALYRPFCKQTLYYDETLIDRPGAFRRMVPLNGENRIICVSGPSSQKPFQCLMTNEIAALDLIEKTQCFPLYTYAPDASTRFDNVTSYALSEARRLYGAAVSREDIFYATYALLHHPGYRAKYAENLKRELPRLPLFLAPLDFREYSRIGRALGELHVGYENAKPFPFKILETKITGQKFSPRVQKMKFNAERTHLKVNDFLTLSGFTPQMFDYKLGNRSALDWIVESYRVKEDARSGLVSDPNRKDEPKFILDLVAKVATVSLETQKLIAQLPPLFS